LEDKRDIEDDEDILEDVEDEDGEMKSEKILVKVWRMKGILRMMMKIF